MLIGIVLAVVAAQAVALGVLWRRVSACEQSRARVDRMGEAIAMLSETAEAGFAAVAQELDKQRRAPSVRPTATRATIARRVVKAASAGDTVEAIARREAMSEGEVRLHLALAESSRLQSVPRPAQTTTVETQEAPAPAVSTLVAVPAPPTPRAKATRSSKAPAPAPVPAAVVEAARAAARKGARRAAVRA